MAGPDQPAAAPLRVACVQLNTRDDVAANVRTAVRLIEEAGKDYVGATMDAGNAAWTLEDPLANLEVLGPYAVTSGLRDSAIWETERGATVLWSNMGRGVVDWKAYVARFRELCPGVPFVLEICSYTWPRELPYLEAKFWDVFPDARAADFARFVALAFGPRGSLDPTFGGDGKVFTDLTPKADIPFALAIQGDGKIVVAGGAAQDGPDPKFALVRYDRDGSLDPNLRGDGTVISNVTPYGDLAYSVAIDLDGRIVAAGQAGSGGRAPRFGTVRYLADGTRDRTFGGDGKVSSDLTPFYDSAFGVAVQADGSVVCSGVAGSGGSHASFAVVRYQP
jgi:uncharacterized delta-60 repeat protein